MHSISNLFSICIPVYNAEDFISRTIYSSLKQTYQNIEVIAIDDKSTDKTVSVLRSIDDNRFRYIVNRTNLGLNRNWQKCIDEAKGDFIVVLGHDDELEHNFVSGTLKIFNQYPEVAAVVVQALIYNSKRQLIGKTKPTLSGYVPALKNKKSILKYKNISPPSQTALRLKAVRSVSGFPTGFNYAPEAPLYAKLAINGWDAFYLNDFLVKRWQNPYRVTSSGNATLIRRMDLKKFYFNFKHEMNILDKFNFFYLYGLRYLFREMRTSIKRMVHL